MDNCQDVTEERAEGEGDVDLKHDGPTKQRKGVGSATKLKGIMKKADKKGSIRKPSSEVFSIKDYPKEPEKTDTTTVQEPKPLIAEEKCIPDKDDVKEECPLEEDVRDGCAGEFNKRLMIICSHKSWGNVFNWGYISSY